MIDNNYEDNDSDGKNDSDAANTLTVVANQLQVDKVTVCNNAVQLMLQNNRRNLTIELLQRKQISHIQQSSPRFIWNNLLYNQQQKTDLLATDRHKTITTTFSAKMTAMLSTVSNSSFKDATHTLPHRRHLTATSLLINQLTN